MTAPTTDAPIPFWEDLLEIFYAPRAVFERRNSAGFWLPWLALVVALLIIFAFGRSLVNPIIEAEIDRSIGQAMKHNPKLTPEIAEKQKAFAIAMIPVSVPAAVLFGPMLIGLALWIFGKFVEARQELEAACLVASYALFPRIIESLINLLQAAVLPAEQLTSHFVLQLGPARFLDPDQASPVLMAVLGRCDLVTLWCTALLAIGLAVTGRIPLQRAAIAAGLVWLSGGLLPVVGALLSAG